MCEWKIPNCTVFSAIQISREINFGDSTSAKSAVLTYLEALNFGFYEFVHFLRMQFTKFIAPKLAKTEVLGILDSLKLISRKIWVADKSFFALCCGETQCGNFRIFLSHRFCVKSILQNLEVLKTPFLPFWGNFSHQTCKNS